MNRTACGTIVEIDEEDMVTVRWWDRYSFHPQPIDGKINKPNSNMRGRQMKPGDLVRITNEKTTHKMPRVSLALVECWNPPDEEKRRTLGL
jgi:hypothetical protein